MNYIEIENESVCNGDGLRVVLWCSGCSLHCRGCQNPQTWDATSGILFDNQAKEEIFEQLSKPYIAGLTLSGGHPLEDYNVEEIYKLVKEVKEKFPKKTIWLYTGFEWNSLMSKVYQPTFPNKDSEHIIEIHKKRQEIISLCNIVVDGEYIDEQKDLTLKWRGSSNQRVIDVKQSIKQGKVVLYCD